MLTDLNDAAAFEVLWNSLDTTTTRESGEPKKHEKLVTQLSPKTVYLSQVRPLSEHAKRLGKTVGQFQVELANALYLRGAPASAYVLSADIGVGVLVQASGRVTGYGLVTEGWTQIEFE